MNIKVVNNNEKSRVTIYEEGKQLAAATCFYKNTPKLKNKYVGTIGEIECDNIEALKKVIHKCIKILKEMKIEYVVAPMNQTTWKKYRTLKSTSNESMFLLENVDPLEYNEVFLKSEFDLIHTYTSNKGKISDAYNSEVLKLIADNLEKEKITIRKVNKADIYNELTKIYNVCIKSFCNNPFYTDISKEEYIKQYEKYIDMLDDDFILLAEKEKETIGFVFSIPNYNELKEKGKVTTLILKTIAVLPEYEEFGIGNIMLKKIEKIAKEKGYEDWIFAFMYDKNTSQKMAKRNKAEVIREYVLYGRKI